MKVSNNLDLKLIEDVLLVKFNRGLTEPHDITLLSVRINPDGDLIGTIRIHNSTLEIMDMLMTKSEYTNLLRQKKLKQIGL
jgi:hypothetical protein